MLLLSVPGACDRFSRTFHFRFQGKRKKTCTRRDAQVTCLAHGSPSFKQISKLIYPDKREISSFRKLDIGFEFQWNHSNANWPNNANHHAVFPACLFFLFRFIHFIQLYLQLFCRFSFVFTNSSPLIFSVYLFLSAIISSHSFSSYILFLSFVISLSVFRHFHA